MKNETNEKKYHGGLYSLSQGMKDISVSENNKKNELPIGTVLQLNGYSNPQYVIVKNYGINGSYSHYGSQYVCVDLESYQQVERSAFELKWLSEKADNRIQIYITNEIKPASDVVSLLEKSEIKRKHQEDVKAFDVSEHQRLIEKGKELFAKVIPTEAKSIIVATYEVDDCDLQSDYFSTKTTKTVVIGWSKHNRDIFSELRKAAANFEPTKELAIPSTVDRSENPKTEQNAKYWHPSDEHREKYSMGAGYYLGSDRYRTGWKIRKENIGDDTYYYLGKWGYREVRP